MAEPAYIYALHLRGGEYRYIGITNDPDARFTAHKSAAKTGISGPVYQWMREHAGNVEMTVIDVCESYDHARAMERYWIGASRAGEVDMLNVRSGGGSASPRSRPRKVIRISDEAYAFLEEYIRNSGNRRMTLADAMDELLKVRSEGDTL